MLQIAGLILALIVLIVLVFKQAPTVVAVTCAAIVAGVFNRMEIWTALNTLAEGTGSTFASYFFVFLFSTVYGELMSSVGCANSIAVFLVKLFGKKNVVLIIILTTALLVYGGVTAMVVCFTVCPIGISLLKDANISKKFLPALIAFGQGTFALTALPGTPQLNNIIPTEALKTTSTAAPVLGITAGLAMFLMGTLYLQYEVNKSIRKGEGFDPATLPASYREGREEEGKLNAWLAFLPMIILVVCYILFENVSFFGYRFSEQGAYSAIATAMLAAICYLIFLGFKTGKWNSTKKAYWKAV